MDELAAAKGEEPNEKAKYAVCDGCAAIFPVAMTAQTANPECTGVQLNTKAVALAAPITFYSVVDFSGSGGQLDPTPLLQTDIHVVGLPRQAACVTVTFSTQADPQD
ncbi:MAG: hypothetical protein HY013_21985 [Candidatus Solibacter usitatus]|nr:hypothetical protein [Candidatus Solibacter usitatus]